MNEILFIVMPAYNEEEAIEETIKSWYKVIEKVGEASRLIVFNDGSKDNTSQIVSRLSTELKQLQLIDKPNSGHGSTCTYAYNYSISQGADFVFQTDSDGQTNPEEFWSFWEQRNQYDFIIGYRALREDGQKRVFASKVLSFVIKIVFRVSVPDSNTPFRLMKVEKLKHLMNAVPTDFFLSNVIISTLVVMRNESQLWLPITFRPRQGGVNSINFKRMFSIGVKSIIDFYAIKPLVKKVASVTE